MKPPLSWLRFAALTFATAAVVGCVSIDETVPPVTALSARGGNAAQLDTGRSLYLQKCTTCHVAEPVRKYPTSDWPRIVTEMSGRSKLTPADERAILAYVLAASR